MYIGIGVGVGFNSKGKRILARDSFERADNETTLGTTDTGQVWSSNYVWGISGNKAYNPGAQNGSYAFLDVGAQDYSISALLTLSANEGLCFRYSDAGSTMLARITPGADAKVGLYKISGTTTSLLPDASLGSFTAGQQCELKVTIKNNKIDVFVNGILRLSATDSFNQTITKCGFRANGSVGGRFDNFIVESL